MNTVEVLCALNAGTLPPDKAVKKLIALGADGKRAREALKVVTDRSWGDATKVPDRPKTAKPRKQARH